MFKIVDKTIHLTRGDACTISVGLTKKNQDGTDEPYIFKAGDIVSIGVYPVKGLNTTPLLFKSITLEEESDRADIPLSSEETKLGVISSKATKYWYEIQLNHIFTIVGFDEDGPKLLNLYPEGVEEE